MAELAFLSAIAGQLAVPPLIPAVAANRIGALEPVDALDLPSVVLSLESSVRRRVGLGDRSELMTGALRVPTTIDLANPLLPGDPLFSLVDVTRRVVTLLHGGLVRSDGVEATTPLTASDLTVALDGAPLAVVTGVPAAGQVRADPVTGQLLFGAALPDAGTLALEYFLGTWERRVERIAGVLRLESCATTAAAAESLGATCVRRLLAPEVKANIPVLMAIELSSLSSVEHRSAPAPPEVVGVAHFRRRAGFTFEYQHLVDRADSSGGVIRSIPIATRLETDHTDRATGSLIHEIVDVN